MADESDVEEALVALVSDALYPGGVGSQSVIGPDCRVYRGWPNPSTLNADLSAGRVNVTVFPVHGRPGYARTTTRYAETWAATLVAPALTVSVLGKAATFAGTAAPRQLAGLLIDGRTYSYRAREGDNPVSIAACLGTLVQADTNAYLSGATLTVPDAAMIKARVVGDSQSQLEIRRQEMTFRISCWCPTPLLRDGTATVIDLSLAQLSFIVMGDGSSGRIIYNGTIVLDQSENALLYRRDIMYQVEYPTLIYAAQPTMLFGETLLNAGSYKV